MPDPLGHPDKADPPGPALLFSVAIFSLPVSSRRVSGPFFRRNALPLCLWRISVAFFRPNGAFCGRSPTRLRKVCFCAAHLPQSYSPTGTCNAFRVRKVPAVFAQGGILTRGPCAQNPIICLLARKVSPLFFHLARPGVAEAQIAHFHQLRTSPWRITF